MNFSLTHLGRLLPKRSNAQGINSIKPALVKHHCPPNKRTGRIGHENFACDQILFILELHQKNCVR